jgi:esterase/lipase superfamily enzyme
VWYQIGYGSFGNIATPAGAISRDFWAMAFLDTPSFHPSFNSAQTQNAKRYQNYRNYTASEALLSRIIANFIEFYHNFSKL